MSVRKQYVRVAVQGGKVVLSPQIAELLKENGFNPDEISKRIAEKVSPILQLGFRNVNVEVDFVPRSYYEINVIMPPVTELLLRCAGREEGPHSTQEVVGNLDLAKAAEIAYYKFPELKSRDFKRALKQVLSAAATIGITVNGRNPRDVIKEVDGGAYDDIIAKFEKRLREEGLL